MGDDKIFEQSVNLIAPKPGGSLYHALFAARVPSVPDLSSYQRFKDVDEIEQLRRVLNAQRLFLMGLNVQPDLEQGYRAFELRYIWDGHKLTLAFLGKGAAGTSAQATVLARELWSDLTKLFPRDLYRGGLQLVRDERAFGPIYEPFAIGRASVVVLEKQVAFGSTLRLGHDYATPHPFKWGVSSMAALCKTMLRQEQPHLVSVALAPAVLSTEEAQALNVLAGVLHRAGEGREKSRRMGMMSTLATGSRQVTSRDQFGQAGREAPFLPDPQARLHADVYETYLARLERPLMVRLYVAAQHEVAPSVVGALQAEMIGQVPMPSDPTEETALPHIPREFWLGSDQLERARANLAALEFEAIDDGPSNLMLQVHGELGDTCAALARLPRLVDVQEACCAFRLPALPRRDEIGMRVHSGAFVTLAQPEPVGATCNLGHRDDGRPHRVPLADLTQHVLVVGTTGSGKTTTCLNLLADLAENGMPFLVIEPVNAEHDDYRALKRLPSLRDRLQVFSLGDEETAPFRLNPFEIQAGVTVAEHISSMLTCFKAAIPMWEPLPRLFLKALNRTYYRKGWTAYRKPKGHAGDPPFPTLRDFYREISWVVEREIEHEGEVKGNIRGASKLRIEALMEGSCGRILSARESLPIETWMERPTILELRHIGDDEDKALMMAFALQAVNEYLDKGRARGRKGQLQHVILIEEAHRLLENVSEDTSPEQANTKGQAAQAFARALAENRKYGEGIIIAEQLPTKLVPDVIGNTGLKVMHRLTSKDDREVMGKAMKFDEFQEEHVVTLKKGEVAVYGLDLEEPVMVRVPNFWETWERFGVESRPVRDSEVSDFMSERVGEYAERYLPYATCTLCPAICKVRDHGEALIFDKSLALADSLEELCAGFEPQRTPETQIQQLLSLCERTIDRHARIRPGRRLRKTLTYCLFLHLKDASGLFEAEHDLVWSRSFRVVQENQEIL